MEGLEIEEVCQNEEQVHETRDDIDFDMNINMNINMNNGMNNKNNNTVNNFQQK